ncbi:L,D-transpeptidase family protein [Sphingomonas sp. BN140010]|uniref:L,D-transpeptidase family protein n=1 Tax=Sphingomonas arvum TaxID=2992113 RepID=A0ABT3JB24_9SPHN|nr:L,D-transpeptidase family protein [Sphingomonas sp. BN140010]MCW3796260.1 L,D-transpeptidase family protein [Sphingomonas sp. BN140010]
MNARFLCVTLMASATLVPAATWAQTAVRSTPAPTAPASARTAQPTLPPGTDPLAPTAPAATPAPPPPPPPVVEMAPPVWPVAAAQDLLTYIRGVAREGLDPRDYDPDTLQLAIRGGDPATLAKAATGSFRKVARDLALGHVPRSARTQWFVTDPDLDVTRSDQLLVQAVSGGRVADILNGLLPTHPQYGALRQALALAKPGDTAAVNKIRTNMDRWRWLPRDLGQKYIIVNVPGQFATLVENSQTRWKHRAIAGAVRTPTPQLSVNATGVILNPWWEVPPSLSGEVAGKAGYVAVKGKDGKVQRWRQPPGARNALGKIKFVMQNPHNIYLHDTNNRGLFDSRARFLSHGCIRTEHILDLAAELLADDGGEWTQERIDSTLASAKTVKADFVKPVPVYIVYFSTAALTDGSLVQYDDLYKRDGAVLAALNDRDGPKTPGTTPTKTASSK